MPRPGSADRGRAAPAAPAPPWPPRPPTRGGRWLAATAHPLATLVAADVLRSGGRAADAAVAANAVLAVVLPHACGPGGDLYALVLDAGAVGCLEGVGRSGSGASIDLVRGRGLSAIPPTGAMAVSVPGCVDAWGGRGEGLALGS